MVEPHVICTVGETIFVTDAASGNVKLINELLGATATTEAPKSIV